MVCASKLGVVLLTGDFNEGAERELSSGGTEDQRRISPLEAASDHAAMSWPTSVVTPLWGPGAEPRITSGPKVADSSKMPG